MKEFYQLFYDYTHEFDMLDSDINYKYRHSLDVANVSKVLKPDRLFEIIAIFHDIGRFEQKTQVNTFRDDNFDHGDFGEVIVKDLLKDMISPEEMDIVRFAIKNHNKLFIEPADEIKTYYAKLIRDADKIDIIRQCCDGTLRYMDFSQTPDISDFVTNEFFSHRLISNKNYKYQNSTEKIVGLLAFCFDIYFKESADIILNHLENAVCLNNYSTYKDECIKYFKNATLENI